MKSEDRLSPKTMWTCTYCDKSFKYESEKRRHEQSHVPQFKCGVCSKKFSFLSALRRHEKQHVRTGTVQCGECGGNFRDETLLKRHMQYAHTGTYTCQKCSTTFNSEPALRTHMKTHKPEAERRFRCSFLGCAKTFNFPHHLKHHELTHTDAKQHFCKECGKGFIQAHHLKIHMKNHEPDEWLSCVVPGCSKTFTNEYARRRHLATHKIKTDSGISSDSSNCEFSTTKMSAKDKCSENISHRTHKKQTSQCISIEDKPQDLSLTTQISYEPTTKDTNTEQTCTIEQSEEPKMDCEQILGGCIVGDIDANSNCICAQINNTIDEYDPMLPNIVKLNDSMKESNNSLITYKSCDCANTCKAILNGSPTIVYNGTVKIKDTFDLSINTESVESEKGELPMNSCRDVLGNCIVSGNGTMGEGCLCARMTADDVQMTEQEIDDITPCPTYVV